VGYFERGPDDLPCIADGHVTVIRANHQAVDARFLFYWLSSAFFYDYANSSLAVGATNQTELYPERLGRTPVALPPLDEQSRIADFLDAETARIDSILATQAAQSDVLAELELAKIAFHLGGDDAVGERTETGWPWLPKIPKDWLIGPIYAYFSIQLGKMLNAERSSGGSQRPYLRNANIRWYEIEIDDLKTMSFESDEVSRYTVRPGDLLVCEGGYVGRAAVWEGQQSQIFYQKSLHRVRPISNLPVEWLMYWLRLASACGVFAANGNQSTIQHLTGEQLAEYRIPIPGDSGMRAARIADAVKGIRKTRAQMDKAVNLLRERRQ
nr:restriction endonuclease subunit S [Micromonospora sp. DSM 115978]